MTKRSTAIGLIAVSSALGLPMVGHASVPPTSEPAGTEVVGDASATSAAGPSPVDLSAVCPATIVIQTDWFPESEYGAVYGLLGDDYEIDVDNKIVSASLVTQGEPTGVNIEIRAGGLVFYF